MLLSGLPRPVFRFSVSVQFSIHSSPVLFVKENISVGLAPPDNRDLAGIREYFLELSDLSPDALIISDPGVFEIAREVLPQMEIHISTQANNVNYLTCLFWKKLGAKRVVTARELSLAEIAEIRANIPDDLELETFVHGAMCISYSGRCLLSNYFTGRDANMGACTHPCRWKYYLTEETRPGEYLPVFENDRGTYIFNSRLPEEESCCILSVRTFSDLLTVPGKILAVAFFRDKIIVDCPAVGARHREVFDLVRQKKEEKEGE